LRDGEAERLGGLEIEDQLECGRLLDRQIGRLGALEDLSGVNADLAVGTGEAHSIADQAAGRGVFTPVIDRRDRMACRQRQELLAPAEEERVAGEDERAGMQLDEGCEGGVDLAFAAGLQDMEPHPLHARRFLHVSYVLLGGGIVRVHK
jgi:hypothetical protein